MTTYTPPAEAVEAAAIEICGHGKNAFYEYPYNERAREDFRAKARAALTAAGPIIAAEALREAASAAVTEEEGIPWDDDHDRATVSAWLDDRAARIARGEGS